MYSLELSPLSNSSLMKWNLISRTEEELLLKMKSCWNNQLNLLRNCWNWRKKWTIWLRLLLKIIWNSKKLEIARLLTLWMSSRSLLSILLLIVIMSLRRDLRELVRQRPTPDSMLSLDFSVVFTPEMYLSKLTQNIWHLDFWTRVQSLMRQSN